MIGHQLSLFHSFPKSVANGQTEKKIRLLKSPFVGRSGSKNHSDGSFYLTLAEVWSSDLHFMSFIRPEAK